jgi:hypothetical protein
MMEMFIEMYNVHFFTIYILIAQSVQRWATGWTIGAIGFDSR